MIELNVDNGTSIVIKDGFANEIGLNLKTMFSKVKVMIVSDDAVFAMYGGKIKDDLSAEGFEIYEFVLEPDRTTKNMNVFVSLVEFMGKMNFEKNDLVLAIGGRMVMDVAGLAASLYQGGMNFVQLPTTLAASLESSLEPCRTINLKSSSHFVSNAYSPSAVYVDFSLFKSLQETNFKAGFAQMLKYALYCDGELFAKMEEGNLHENIEYLISAAIRAKIAFQKVEASGFSVFSDALSRVAGSTVAEYDIISYSLVLMTGIALKNGDCNDDVHKRLLSLVSRLGLASRLPYAPVDLKKVILNEKVCRKGFVELILPSAIGEYREVRLPVDKYDEWFQTEYDTENRKADTVV